MSYNDLGSPLFSLDRKQIPFSRRIGMERHGAVIASLGVNNPIRASIVTADELSDLGDWCGSSSTVDNVVVVLGLGLLIEY